LVQVIAVCYALFILAPSSRLLQMVLAASPLIRAELAVPLVMSMVWARSAREKKLAAMTGAAILFSGSWVSLGYTIMQTFYQTLTTC